MKNLIRLFTFFLFSTIFVLNTFAEELPISKIFNIVSYSFNEKDKIFNAEQYGSAVLIGKNQVITNAHVVLDEKDKPLGNYNLCITDSFENEPKCQYAMKLVKYNSELDLALLVPASTKIDLGTPVKVSGKKLNIGDSVKVLGYPSNGGSTITLSEGKISGKEDEFYKIDANIDSGNSGGGAFDKDNKLIGIPTIASVGLSTLGYMVSVETITSFLADKNVTTYNKVDDVFIKDIGISNNFYNNQIFESINFSVSKPSKYGFKFDGYDSNTEMSLVSTYFSNKNDEVNINIKTSEIRKIFAFDSWNKYEEEIQKSKYDKVIIRYDMKLGNMKFDKFSILKGDKYYSNPDYLEFLFKNGNIEYKISTDDFTKNKKDFINGLKFVLSGVKVLKNQNKTINEINFDVINFKIDDNTNYSFLLNDYGSIDRLFYLKTENDYNEGAIVIKEIEEEMPEDLKEKTFNEYMSLVDESYYSYMKDYITENKIKITKKGLLYRIMGMTQEKDAKNPIKKSYTITFIYELGGKFYSGAIAFLTKNDSEEFKKALDNFLENIEVSGKSPFKGYEVGDLKIESPKTEEESTTQSGTVSK